ncbi:hypothetical protein [Cellulomonas sp. ATA003]|uniref:hypothetical protein n=1 Tax=Cellulomonas sp. ATA003 TaxID=3073064 RepID=UPI00287347AF|nr:hypothetical protein [Cellulomonas sp. ATA003]WNB85198.1 hypothetical protein REH70_16405 [Cellulomonas sp. ATA003]
MVLTHAAPGVPVTGAPPAASTPAVTTTTADDDRAAAASAADVIRRAAEADVLRRRYDALSSSRLGRTQLGYWRLRSRLRKAVRRSP